VEGNGWVRYAARSSVSLDQDWQESLDPVRAYECLSINADSGSSNVHSY
jgi:hypothetical protein